MARGEIENYVSDMAPWMLIAAMLEIAPPAGSPAVRFAEAFPPFARRLHAGAALVTVAPRQDPWSFSAGSLDPEGGPPACVNGICQPRVSIPGREITFSGRGKTTELALALLDRAHLEPFATMVWGLAYTGIRFSYTPAHVERSLSTGHGGWGRAQVVVRWRLDAWNAPVWPVRGRPLP
jgi:hypothetical protein